MKVSPPVPSNDTCPGVDRRSGGVQNTVCGDRGPDFPKNRRKSRLRPEPSPNRRKSLASRRLNQNAPRPEPAGVTYYQYRWYDPLTGRWPSRDSIEENGGENLFGFCYNNSFGWYDYLGADPRPQDGGFAFTGNPAEGDDDWFRKKAKQGTGDNQGEGKTGEDLFEFLKKLTKDNCCIRKLNLVSHGGPDGLGGTEPGISGFVVNKEELKKTREEMNLTFPGMFNPDIHEGGRDLDDLKTSIDSGSTKFCKKCEIRIYGCYQSNLPVKLAELTKCDVIAVKDSECGPSLDKRRWNGDFHRYKPDGTIKPIGRNYDPLR